jgi:hypothetical protein
LEIVTHHDHHENLRSKCDALTLEYCALKIEHFFLTLKDKTEIRIHSNLNSLHHSSFLVPCLIFYPVPKETPIENDGGTTKNTSQIGGFIGTDRQPALQTGQQVFNQAFCRQGMY